LNYEELRVRILAAAVGALRAAAALVGKLGKVLDIGLRRLERWTETAAEGLFRALRVEPRDLSVERIVDRLPSPLRRGLERIGDGLGALGRAFESPLAFLPRERAWRKVATGLVLLVVITTYSGFFAPPEAKPLPGQRRPLFIGYFENGWGGMLVDSFPTFQRHVELFDIVMPFWYSLHPSGELEDRGVRPEVADFARAHGVKVVPLVNNAKIEPTAAFLLSPEGRAGAIERVVDEVEEWGYDGVHIDFELLPSSWRKEYTSFIAELRERLGPGRHLSVAVFPKVDVHEEIHGVYDYAALAEICDFIVLMGYDRHWATAPPGPLSPNDWIEGNLQHALDNLEVPPGRLVLAVGAYGYDWPAGGGMANPASTVPSRFAPDLALRRGARLQWDDESRNPFFVYWQDGVKHEVWYQDERVMSTRLAQVVRYGLRGAAVWRVGYETPATWGVVERALGPR